MSLPSTPSKKSRRGAPRGNRNALKHGFYARSMEPADLADLVKLSPTGVDAEIALARILIRRLVASSRSLTDFRDISDLVRTFALASLAFTRLLRTRSLLEDPQKSEVDMAIEEAIRRVGEEYNFYRDTANLAPIPARPDPFTLK